MAESPPREKSRPKYTQEIQAMMYTFGDTRHPLATTAGAIEAIVHQQLLELIVRAAQVSLRRGGRSISAEDLIFALRRVDPGQAARLRDFLGWREVRRTAKSTNTGGSGGGGGGGLEEAGTGAMALAGVGVGEEATESQPAATASGGGEAESQTAEAAKPAKRKAPRLLPWDHLANVVADGTLGARLDWAHEASVTLHTVAQQSAHERLSLADRITRGMSQSEYLEWTECRQASFTYKKPKKFRDWLGPLPCDHRLGEEAVECLGSVACELVRHLTQAALRQRAREEHDKPRATAHEQPTTIALFAAPSRQLALLPRHVQAAHKQLERDACQPANWPAYGLPNRRRLRL